MDELTGAELVKSVALSMPGANISDVLDKTNDILNGRILQKLKSKTFTTVFHLAENLINEPQVLELITSDESFPESLRTEVRKFIDSGLFDSFSKFVTKPKTYWCFKGQ
jgi:hypothetical protein